jgi:hypothetical protein
VKPKDLGSVVKTPCICFGTGVVLCEETLSAVDGVDMIKDAFYRISGETLIKEGLKSAARAEQHDLKPIYGRRSEAEIKFGVKLV